MTAQERRKINGRTCREHNAKAYDRSIDVQILRLRRKNWIGVTFQEK